MIKITINNTAILTNLPAKLVKLIRDLFKINNPLFSQKIELGLSVWGVPVSLSYSTVINQNSIEVPVGGLTETINLLLNNGIKSTDINIVDNRTEFTNLNYFNNIIFTGTLRDYQNDVLKHMDDKTVGIIEAMTGSGKTITFIKYILNKKINTLILVNRIELALQTKKSFEKFSTLTEDDIGLIGAGKFELKPITVGLHQTLMRLDDNKFNKLNNYFGTVIADEVHITAAELYYKNMTSLTMKYKFGFSATPERQDGLTKVIFWATGPKIHKVPTNILKHKVLIIPTIKQVFTDYYFPLFDTADYTYMISDLSTNQKRNKLIATHILKNYSHKDDYVVILCNQLSQVDALLDLLGHNAEKITSKTPKKSRKQIIEDLQNKKIKYIISTYQLFATGIDITHLNVLILAAPKKSKNLLRQAAGRIMRKFPGKTKAVIVDFIDHKVSLLNNQAHIRQKILTNL